MIESIVGLSKAGIESTAASFYNDANDDIEAYAFGDKLEKVAQKIKEMARPSIDILDSEIERDNFRIKVSTRPKYSYIETHELKTLTEQEEKQKINLKSITDLIKNIKEQQVINGEATKIGETVVATVV